MGQGAVDDLLEARGGDAVGTEEHRTRGRISNSQACAAIGHELACGLALRRNIEAREGGFGIASIGGDGLDAGRGVGGVFGGGDRGGGAAAAQDLAFGGFDGAVARRERPARPLAVWVRLRRQIEACAQPLTRAELGACRSNIEPIGGGRTFEPTSERVVLQTAGGLGHADGIACRRRLRRDETDALSDRRAATSALGSREHTAGDVEMGLLLARFDAANFVDSALGGSIATRLAVDLDLVGQARDQRVAVGFTSGLDEAVTGRRQLERAGAPKAGTALQCAGRQLGARLCAVGGLWIADRRRSAEIETVGLSRYVIGRQQAAIHTVYGRERILAVALGGGENTGDSVDDTRRIGVVVIVTLPKAADEIGVALSVLSQ